MALGKGLSALIQQDQKETNPSLEILGRQEVSLNLVRDNRFQPRQHYGESALEELAASIKDKGILQPILVRRTGDGYEVIAGERRLKAARKLGLEKIPVMIRDVNDKEALVLALVENVQREELNPIEKAESYKRLNEEFGYSQEEVAKSVGKDRATISNLLRLLRLPEDIQAAVSDGSISEGHARALLMVEDPNARKMLFLEAVKKGFSVREMEARAKVLAIRNVQTDKKSTTKSKDPEIDSLEEELRRALGTKVVVENRRGNKGRLLIEYYSLDDLDRILAILRK